jgi:hypothetical protein
MTVRLTEMLPKEARPWVQETVAIGGSARVPLVIQ